MKKATVATPDRGIADGRSTAELFLAWLSMPELGTPVHGPVHAEAATEGVALTAVPVRNGRRRVCRPEHFTRSLAHR